jgi:GT2 family glycosyltransferase
MDADDLCEPERLQREWEVMRDNPDVALVGSLCDGIDTAGNQIRPRDRWRIVRHSPFPPFPHGSVMFRRQIFEAVGGYRKAFEGHEDMDLFRRMAEKGRVVTLPEALYHFRYHAQNSTGKELFKLDTDIHRNHNASLTDLYHLGAMRLWSGRAPNIFRSVREAKIGWSKRVLWITIWSAWADLDPRSLRSFVKKMVYLRDMIASTRVSDGRFYEWRFK